MPTSDADARTHAAPHVDRGRHPAPVSPLAQPPPPRVLPGAEPPAARVDRTVQAIKRNWLVELAAVVTTLAAVAALVWQLWRMLAS